MLRRASPGVHHFDLYHAHHTTCQSVGCYSLPYAWSLDQQPWCGEEHNAPIVKCFAKKTILATKAVVSMEGLAVMTGRRFWSNLLCDRLIQATVNSSGLIPKQDRNDAEQTIGDVSGTSCAGITKAEPSMAARGIAASPDLPVATPPPGEPLFPVPLEDLVAALRWLKTLAPPSLLAPSVP